MATDLESRDGDAPGAAPATRIPDAVWINRPTPGSGGGVGGTVQVFAAAILLGVAVLAAKHAATEPLLPRAVAGTADAADTGPTGCFFPARFDRTDLAPGDQPPTF